METTDKATAIREARQQLRARGERDSMNRVVAFIGSSKRTVRKYWSQSNPEAAPMDAGPPAPAPVPVAAAPPAPEPAAFSLENLRAYYLNRFESPWPQGVTPPVEAYPVLQALWKEANDAIGKADRQRLDVFNALAAARVRDLDHHPELRQVDNRRGTARLIIHSVQTDMDTVRRRAHARGIELPDPRLS